METTQKLFKDLELDYSIEVDTPKESLNSLQLFYLSQVKDFNIDRVFFSGDFPSVFIKKVETFSLETYRGIAEIHKKAWNFRKVLFLYVYSDTEIRVYNCNARPIFIPNDIETLDFSSIELYSYSLNDDKEKLDTLLEIFSRIGIDTGAIWGSSLFKKIDENKRVDRALVNSLKKARTELLRSGLKEVKFIHNLLIRSLFILYLEDKKATPIKLYNEILPNAFSYFDILANKEATYKFFSRIESHFNGNVFPVTDEERRLVTDKHLEIVKNCFWDGDFGSSQQVIEGFRWKAFSFDIIPIELLSEIYENFLENEDKKQKNSDGTHYTPIALVELILNEVLPHADENNTNYKLKILDSACGSGIFLVEAYKRLVERWKFVNKNKKITFETLSGILTNSIFGVEINSEAIKVTAFSLYLAMLHYLEPPTLWADDESKSFPYLIDDLDLYNPNRGNNLFCTNAIMNDSFHQPFDIIVGNPPFGKRNLKNHKYITEYCNKRGYAPEFAVPFLHKAATISPDAKIALVFPAKILTNTQRTSQKFRDFLFKECYVEKVYNLSILRKAPKKHGGNLFTSAVGPAGIIFYQAQKKDKGSKTITYWAPKTFIKNHIAEGVVIDSSDVKYLPREECLKPYSKIWKIAMWGTMEDYEIIERILKTSLKLFKDDIQHLNKGVGFQNLDKSTKKPLINNEIAKYDCVKPENIKRYYTNKSLLLPINNCIKTKDAKDIYVKHFNVLKFEDICKINVFRRIGNIKTFEAPHVLIKEGLKNNRICASFLDVSCSFNSKVFGISGKNAEELKAITVYLNSDFVFYLIFFISASWGIEREEIKPNELYLLPSLPQNKEIKDAIKIIDDLVSLNDSIILNSNNESEKKLNALIYDYFKLPEYQRYFIEDTLKYSIDLFHLNKKSEALKPIQKEESRVYAQTICSEINEFLVASDLKVGATIYKIENYKLFPLNLIKLSFGDKPAKVVEADATLLSKTIKLLNDYTISEYAQGVYFRKHLRYYDGNDIYILKPNQKRFWSRSSAIVDAKDLISEILKM